MIYRIFTSLALIIFATGAQAQTPMSAAEFEAYFTGKTMYFEFKGRPFGGEQYMPNRRVRWSVENGKCETGQWYPSGEMICFVYDGNPDPKCWSFYQNGTDIQAFYQNDPTQTMLRISKETAAPLMCLGPEVGV